MRKAAQTTIAEQTTVPDRVRPQIASAADMFLSRLRLRLSPLGREMDWFCTTLEDNIFPAARGMLSFESEVAFTTDPSGRTLLIETGQEQMGPFSRLGAFLRGIGARELLLDTDLESNQVHDVLVTVWSVRRLLSGKGPGTLSRVLGRPKVWEAMLSEKGLHVSCTDVKFDPDEGRLTLRNSYCPLTFSRAVTWYAQKVSRLDDHRAFFHAAPRYALAAVVLFLLPTLLVMWLGWPLRIALYIDVVLAVFVGALVLILFETVGAVQYDKEYQARQLELRNEELMDALNRIQSDLRRARRVQRMFIPKEPEQPFPDDVHVFHTYVPEMAVGGDYYDLKRIGDRGLAVLFSDASGHGMASAFVTGIIKTTFELSDDGQLEPEHFVRRVNEVLEQFTPPDSFAAVLFALYDVEARTLCYVNAGHQPLPLLLRPGNPGIQELDGETGLVAGISRGFDYQAHCARLEPGDRLVFCTDGIIERMNERQEVFGIGRLRELLVQRSDLPAAALPDLILRAVAEHGGDVPQEDDQTVLVMEVLG
jgi:serine phosphatase RsbU (regulator of sigma subunit)